MPSVNRWEISHTRLEVVAWADNPNRLIAILGRGPQAIKAGGAVFVTRWAPVEVVPRSHMNCIEEIYKLGAKWYCSSPE